MSQRWQPIETAPKDGTPVLIWDAWPENYPSPGVAAWGYGGEGRTGGWCWWGTSASDEYPGNGPIGPSHWMPLPAAPKR